MLVESPSYRSKNKYFAGHPPSNIREASISRIASISRGMPAKATTPQQQSIKPETPATAECQSYQEPAPGGPPATTGAPTKMWKLKNISAFCRVLLSHEMLDSDNRRLDSQQKRPDCEKKRLYNDQCWPAFLPACFFSACLIASFLPE
jgi:hypothetical protein